MCTADLWISLTGVFSNTTLLSQPLVLTAWWGLYSLHTHTHTHTHTNTHKHTHTHKHTYTHTHTTHTHIHTHTIISFPITCTFSQGALTQRSSSSGEPPPSSSNTINSMPLISPNYFEYFSFPLIWSCEVLAGEGCSKLG